MPYLWRSGIAPLSVTVGHSNAPLAACQRACAPCPAASASCWPPTGHAAPVRRGWSPVRGRPPVGCVQTGPPRRGRLQSGAAATKAARRGDRRRGRHSPPPGSCPSDRRRDPRGHTSGSAARHDDEQTDGRTERGREDRQTDGRTGG